MNDLQPELLFDNPLRGSSPARQAEMIQQMLNEAAGAKNYEIQEKTVRAFQILSDLALNLKPAGRTSYYLLHYAWIRWLADWDNFSLNLLHRRRLIAALNRTLGPGRFDLQIFPYASRIYHIYQERRVRVIQLHEGLDYMNERECETLAVCVHRCRWNEFRALIGAYQQREPRYAEMIALFRETKAAPAPENNTRGKVYDLEQVFESCNRRCFGGKMPRPAGIYWSKQPNKATMGKYDLNEDSVMINCALDSRSVPAYVLDFIMYHELLHKALGVETKGGRRRAHTPKFRALEKAHPDYARAQEFLKNRFGRR